MPGQKSLVLEWPYREGLRIDEANLILGLRLNIWVSLIVLVTASAYLIANKRRGNTKENHIPS